MKHNTNKKIRAIFLGKKPSSAEALSYLIQKGIKVTAVVAPPKESETHWEPKLTDTAKNLGISLATEEELYQCITNPKNPPRKELTGCTENIDIVFSFLFWNKIKKPLIDLPKIGTINFHPAPLPDIRGVGGYNLALYEGMKDYGVSAHFIAENIDEGDIIHVERFPINHPEETVFSLEQKSQKHLVNIFKKVTNDLLQGKKLPRTKQGSGRYFSKKDFEKLRLISENDRSDVIKRKIRAFWYPPYQGAGIILGGNEYTVTDESILKMLGEKIHRNTSLSKKGFLDEDSYKSAVAGLTLKYVDILVVLKAKGKPDLFVLGKRKENPGKGFIWPAGGRSKHLVPYNKRAVELIEEDFSFNPKLSKLSFIGNARLFWKNSRFEDRKGGIATDGDITIFSLELNAKTKLSVGECFTEIAVLTEKEARKQNTYINYIIDCYQHQKKYGIPQPVPKDFHF